MDYYEIYNSMELPKLGAGTRRVFVVKQSARNTRLFYPTDISFHNVATQTFRGMVITKIGKFRTETIARYIQNYQKSIGIKSKQLTQVRAMIKEAA